MIYPTARAVLFAAIGAPLALLLAAFAPAWWLGSVGWVVLAVGALLADALLAPGPGRLSLNLTTPPMVGAGAASEALIQAAFTGAAPGKVELAVGLNDRLTATPRRPRLSVVGGRAEARLTLQPIRRGEGMVDAVWARWQGPLGLAWVQRREVLGRAIPITPDVQGVKKEALRLFARDAPFGAKAQLEAGEGTEFHALKDFQTGMEPRQIDWKQSARHGKLVAKENRTERNHQVILALDCGRLMSAPIEGVARIDRAINAALLLAFVSLKLGDRVGLFAFDSKPRVSSGTASGAQAFPLLQRLAARIDYSVEETNFTLGLTALSGQLDRRALVVVFTDFADATSAELMLENAARLVRTHLVLFVVFRDQALEALTAREPLEPADVSCAVMAGQLLQQREVVINRLKRLGVQIIEAPADAVGPELVNRYLDAKRRSLL